VIGPNIPGEGRGFGLKIISVPGEGRGLFKNFEKVNALMVHMFHTA